jgi:ribosomal protein S12
LLGFELADHSLGLVVEGADDLVGVRFRVVKSQAGDREIDDFMTVPRSRPG